MKIYKKLTAKWSKRENDIVYVYPYGIQTKCDASYLNDKLEEIRVEMEKRGYDWQTMKFEVSPRLPNFERFPALSGKEESD